MVFERALVDDDAKPLQRLSNKELFFQNIDYLLDFFLIYVLTLSIFSGFLYENTGTHHQLGSWYPLVLIAMYNVWDLIAGYIPLIECIKLESRKSLMIAIFSRFLLVHAFYFTAKYGDQGWMILLVSFLGLTNGYLTVCVMTVAPKGYKGPEQHALGVHPRIVMNNKDGTMDINMIEVAIRDPKFEICYPTTTLICLENSHANSGGRCISVEYTDKVGELAKKHGLKLHIDGARIFNASVVSNKSFKAIVMLLLCCSLKYIFYHI